MLEDSLYNAGGAAVAPWIDDIIDGMNEEVNRPFDSIESAQEFMELLEQTIEEARQQLETDRDVARTSREPRRLEALDLAIYKVNQLALHAKKSRRILNDLRTIRRLLASEIASAATHH